jgi:hypothetical protein
LRAKYHGIWQNVTLPNALLVSLQRRPKDHGKTRVSIKEYAVKQLLTKKTKLMSTPWIAAPQVWSLNTKGTYQENAYVVQIFLFMKRANILAEIT